MSANTVTLFTNLAARRDATSPRSTAVCAMAELHAEGPSAPLGMPPEAVAALRSRVIEIRAAGAGPDGGKATVRSVFDALCAEGGWEAVSLARVKKLCAQLNKEEADAAAPPPPPPPPPPAAATAAAPGRGGAPGKRNAEAPPRSSGSGGKPEKDKEEEPPPAPPAVDPETTLPLWPAAGPDPGEHLRAGPGCIFSIVEIGQSSAGDWEGRGSRKPGDYEYRQSLVELGRMYTPQTRFFVLQDDEQQRRAALVPSTTSPALPLLCFASCQRPQPELCPRRRHSRLSQC